MLCIVPCKITSLHQYLCANFECSQTGLVAVAAPRDCALPVQRIYSKKEELEMQNLKQINASLALTQCSQDQRM